ncbi:DNA-binding XRE family transcriptional regulator [Actinoplanes campanulatus]|uniref:DNA-binding XRE family transcriptional regulator n=1 Tax=Actinoplanes campanulatus TaxID=113559 RepID=A0A7W5FHR0_9ACTN|nr:helix-turn-helix transcriptional regulator [Actinoplanes campanulatus]MBB3098918.1 DNA-binding XRE family transcriptional regulator [Actinoplanes campanulatus]GGN39867.1 hypothetical protein GCM10010109_68320 [Actinoplanes campanulatus]GID40122.1 hypothetical protein Aca09nite_66280 [Actinoplanes campanulatus]
MSDAKRRSHCITNDAPPRLHVNKALFEDALKAKGATTGDAQAQLLGTTRRNVDHYLAGRIEPKLTTARRIAARLGRDIDDLWPAA